MKKTKPSIEATAPLAVSIADRVQSRAGKTPCESRERRVLHKLQAMRRGL